MAERKGRKPSVNYNIYPYPLYDCPRCGCGVAWSGQYRCKFCPECGQKINWQGFPPEKFENWPSYNGPYDWRKVDEALHGGIDPVKVYGVNPITGEMSDTARRSVEKGMIWKD